MDSCQSVSTKSLKECIHVNGSLKQMYPELSNRYRDVALQNVAEFQYLGLQLNRESASVFDE